MPTLHQHAFCPHSRFVRLSLGEMGLAPEIREERPWEREDRFLALNPSGTIPVYLDDGAAIPGAGVIAEYLDETRGRSEDGGPETRRLLPAAPADRAEVRRLVEWFNFKFFDEVTAHLVTEKIFKRIMPAALGGGSPDGAAIRAGRANLRYHLRYIGYLASTRNWLGGDALSYADLAAAAHLSCVDYLGDVPWDEDEAARDWYARVKSRPAFRAILADRIPGMIPPAHYADPDF